MNYDIDFEFIEGFRKPIPWLPSIGFNRRYHTIELVSIGLVREDGKGYYAISREFNPRWASRWVRDNVLAKLPKKWVATPYADDFFGDGVDITPHPAYRTLREIREDVLEFIGRDPDPVFWGYYADYDWVCFCAALFGTMMDLPAHFPKYCRDTKQMLDDTVAKIVADRRRTASADRVMSKGRPWVKAWDGLGSEAAIHAYELHRLKQNPYFPVQAADTAHDAFEDAKHQQRLRKFLGSINYALDRAPK